MSCRSFVLPTLAMLVGSSVAMGADNFGFQIHGFASQGYLRTDGQVYENNGLYGRDTNSGTFELNEFAVNVTATPVDRLRIGAQFIAYDLGKYGNDEVQIDWAFGQYQLPTGISWFDANIVAGRFKTGHGLYNDFRDLDMTRTSVFLPRATYVASFRDFFLAANGAQLNGAINMRELGTVDVSGFVGTQNIDASEGPIFDVFAAGIATTSLPGGLTLELTRSDSIIIERMSGGYLTWNTPLEGLKLKYSNLYVHDMRLTNGTVVINGAAPGASTTIDLYIKHWMDNMLSAEYQMDDFTFAVEYSNQYFKASTDLGPITPFPASNIQTSSRNQGVYGSVNYQLTEFPGFLSKCHVYAAGNWQQNSFPEQNYIKSVMLAVRYDIAEHFLIKAEFERIQNKTATDQHLYGNIFSLKTTFDF